MNGQLGAAIIQELAGLQLCEDPCWGLSSYTRYQAYSWAVKLYEGLGGRGFHVNEPALADVKAAKQCMYLTRICAHQSPFIKLPGYGTDLAELTSDCIVKKECFKTASSWTGPVREAEQSRAACTSFKHLLARVPSQLAFVEACPCPVSMSSFLLSSPAELDGHPAPGSTLAAEQLSQVSCLRQHQRWIVVQM